MTAAELSPNRIVRGAIFPEPVQILVVVPVGDSLKLIGKGVNSSKVYEPILTAQQIATLEATPDSCPFDGDSQRLPHPQDPKTALDVRFIEVKGRAEVDDTALTSNECKTAQRMKQDYCLYIVTHCATKPMLNVLRDPAQLDWQPVVKVEHYRLNVNSIRSPVEIHEDAPPFRA